ncbi:MAG: TonB-dependent receptor plug domain-containing protein [Planctomycetota bacterium]|jgi:iron complex outermembrane receptor protein
MNHTSALSLCLRTAIITTLLVLPAVSAAEKKGNSIEAKAQDFSELKLDQLMDIELPSMMDLTVTSVSKKAEQLAKTAAATYVITQDDIRRTGVTTLADAFRLAPGVTVSTTGLHHSYKAVSIRGYHTFYSSNKLLVLVDGRSVYSPILTTTWWDAHDLMLEDIERIEIIRGPGGTTWGANAMNGVINIITKKAEDTQGGLVSVGLGTVDRNQVNTRYGFKIGEKTFMRVYGKRYHHAGYKEGDADAKATLAFSDQLRIEEMTGKRAGFRIDSTLNDTDTLTISGDAQENRVDTTFHRGQYVRPFRETVPQASRADGGFLLASWTRDLQGEGEISLKGYYDIQDREYHDTTLNCDTLDLEFQHRFKAFGRHEFIWSLGYRTSRIGAERIPDLWYDDEHQTEDLFSFTLQDEIELLEEKLFLTLGTKIQRNTYTGNEYQPSVRLLYTPSEKFTYWASFSRALHTPAHLWGNARYSIILDAGNQALALNFNPNDDLQSETVHAYEAGWRIQPNDRFWLDIAAYHNEYERLITYENLQARRQVMTPTPHLALNRSMDNMLEGYGYGLEIAANWKATKWLTFGGSYTKQHANMKTIEGGIYSPERDIYDRGSPEELLSFRTSFNLPHHVELDIWLRHTEPMQRLNQPRVTDVDIRVGWKPKKNLELSLVGQNLGDKRQRHMSAIEIDRNIFGKLTWQF